VITGPAHLFWIVGGRWWRFRCGQSALESGALAGPGFQQVAGGAGDPGGVLGAPAGRAGGHNRPQEHKPKGLLTRVTRGIIQRLKNHHFIFPIFPGCGKRACALMGAHRANCGAFHNFFFSTTSHGRGKKPWKQGDPGLALLAPGHPFVVPAGDGGTRR